MHGGIRTPTFPIELETCRADRKLSTTTPRPEKTLTWNVVVADLKSDGAQSWILRPVIVRSYPFSARIATANSCMQPTFPCVPLLFVYCQQFAFMHGLRPPKFLTQIALARPEFCKVA